MLTAALPSRRQRAADRCARVHLLLSSFLLSFFVLRSHNKGTTFTDDDEERLKTRTGRVDRL